ncbi:hypothetical protein BCR44DRAFT_125376 [Catenaria anguillulae PL171]|uniref:Rad52/22 family double-strand break repair protein-domain-containing protein n=1 Tax=Catenaria anguillulae PL171 TaxID=765915 RepID=A0A1Y2HQ32_9FUNG|nr:hypothetical protein BCR44DRAFT_125376 [Catenaria anguillulae PL171]
MIGHQELTHLSTTVGIPSAFNTQSPAFPLQQQHPQQPATFGHVPYTYDERERMADALARKLPPDCISQRSGGAAGQVKYIEGWRAIELANEIFGFNGWSMSVLNNSIDFLDNVGPGPNDPRWTVGVTCTVRITLRDGSFREDVGYGIGDNFRTKGQALEKTRKEATTDALKRTLRLFGNSLGNCLHDKDFLRQVNTMPVQRKTLSTEDIYRKGSMMQQPNCTFLTSLN